MKPRIYLRALAALAGLVVAIGATALGVGQPSSLRLKTERFDRDPGWDGHNNRSTAITPRRVRQDFGYSRTDHVDAAPGEIGGFVSPAAEPAYFARPIFATSLDRPLSASGKVVVGPGGGNTLIGFFNAGTLKEWRTPNSLVLRLNGRGDGFHTHLEYATRRWRAGGDFIREPGPATERPQMRLATSGVVHTWSLTYDPRGNNGGGTVTATLDGDTVTLNLDPGHKADGATFNRFGILNVMKSADDGGTLWLDDLRVNGEREALDRDPGWQGYRNRRTYTTGNIRPRFDLGYSRTRHAGGQNRGEIGGLMFRGDQRYPERLAYYGDRIGELTLDHPLRASGKVCLTRGVTDSTTLFGFFHATESMRVLDAQRSGFPENFVGVSIEGPSRDGFFFYPAYGLDREGVSVNGLHQGVGGIPPPQILPDGTPHAWSLEYDPKAGPHGRITVALDGKTIALDVEPEHRAIGARLNRFGFVTTHIDGNGQVVYLDDLTYTTSVAAGG